MVCCTDSQGKGVYFNKEWLSFADAELEQELSYGWVERVHPADVDRLMFKLSLAFKERAPFHYVYRLLNSQGEYRIIETFATPVYNSPDEFLGYIGLSYDRTAKDSSLQELLESEFRYASLFKNNSEVILLIDPSNGDIVDANPAACAFYGYNKDELLKMKIKEINTLPEKEIFAAMQSITFDKAKKFNFKHRLATGEIREVESYASYVTFGGKPYLYSIIHDITDKMLAERQLQDAYIELEQIFNSTAEGMRVIDKDYNIIKVNHKLLEMLGIKKEEALRKKCYEVFPSQKCKSPACFLNLVKNGRNLAEWETEFSTPDGRSISCSVVASPFRDREGNLIGVVESVRDITSRKRYEEQINFLAYHDHLTGLPNKLNFVQTLEQELKRAKENKQKLAVMFMDLDEFKNVNDTLGHSAGDKLLVEFAQRLLHLIRKVDGVARVGGDEFVLYIKDIKGVEEVKTVAEKILNAIEQPFFIKDQEITISASIGISLFPADGIDADTLIKRADSSMYWVKEQSKRSFAFYTKDLNKPLLNRIKTIKNLKNAINKEEFVLHYQPQYHARTGKIVGLEALVRWQHPELGLIMPKDFISLAEETGLIIPIGQKVLLTACSQMRKWQEIGIAPKRLAVNISTCQLRQHDFVDMVKDVLLKTQINPAQLELEITESFAMEKGSCLSVLRELKALGVRIALDDFGTGYSSLSYLSGAPIDVIKIDSSFVKQLISDNNRAIVSAIIAMACTLGMEVTAEGVENKTQLYFLRRTNCRYLQGYLFNKPLSQVETQRLLFKEKKREEEELQRLI